MSSFEFSVLTKKSEKLCKEAEKLANKARQELSDGIASYNYQLYREGSYSKPKYMPTVDDRYATNSSPLLSEAIDLLLRAWLLLPKEPCYQNIANRILRNLSAYLKFQGKKIQVLDFIKDQVEKEITVKEIYLFARFYYEYGEDQEKSMRLFKELIDICGPELFDADTKKGQFYFNFANKIF
ncbi:MAG: hypothetical protein K9K67_12975 [Bacteriovoracaceae bacterium]|nr:hypothetical protein [Bacteriovoracaceae bacterium]